jgi:hypothetical protein
MHGRHCDSAGAPEVLAPGGTVRRQSGCAPFTWLDQAHGTAGLNRSPCLDATQNERTARRHEEPGHGRSRSAP